MWIDLVAHLDLDRHETQVLHEACRVADRCDELDKALRKSGSVLPSGKSSPLLVEARLQQITLARLLAALRLPEDISNPKQRPQRHAGVRGTYRLAESGRQ